MPKCLTLAPMAFYPPMMGDSKRVHRIARALLRHGVDGLCVGKDFLYRGDDDVKRSPKPIRVPSRREVGVRAFLKRAHYNEVKHPTAEWLEFARPYLEDPSFDVVYCQFLFTYPTIAPFVKGRPLFVDTNNSEWGWYDRFAESTSSPLVKAVCGFSKRRADEMLASLPSDAIMVHVSQADLEDYQSRRPELMHLVVPNGADTMPRENVPDYVAPGKKNLLFFGSLGGKMSQDSLDYFARDFWPTLKDDAHMIVAGSHPTESIMALCQQNGWELRKDLTEEQVTQVYDETHYAILPFTYGAGSKLKMMDACGRGVPVLSTKAGAVGQDWLPNFVTIDESPQAWLAKIRSSEGAGADWRGQVDEFGRRYGWEGITSGLPDLMADRLRAKVGAAV